VGLRPSAPTCFMSSLGSKLGGATRPSFHRQVLLHAQRKDGTIFSFTHWEASLAGTCRWWDIGQYFTKAKPRFSACRLHRLLRWLLGRIRAWIEERHPLHVDGPSSWA